MTKNHRQSISLIVSAAAVTDKHVASNKKTYSFNVSYNSIIMASPMKDVHAEGGGGCQM